jgi:hypothetical protein
MIKIACQCGHVGVVSAEGLPRELRCWRCGASRHVKHEIGSKMIQSTAARDERMTRSNFFALSACSGVDPGWTARQNAPTGRIDRHHSRAVILNRARTNSKSVAAKSTVLR